MTFADTPRGVGRVDGLASDSTLLRLAAAAGPLGVVTYFVATAFHPGHDPGNLKAVMPEYAADANWLAVHLAQFAGIALSAVALVTLASSLTRGRGRSAALARLGFVAAVVALAVYAVNQAVDGVGVKFVADSYVGASPADKPGALLVADAIRHLEIGTTSFFELDLGVTLVLLGLAISWSATYPTWLGCVAIADGIGWIAVALLLASRGFDVSVSALAMAVTYVVGLWIVALAILLWRSARRPAADQPP